MQKLYTQWKITNQIIKKISWTYQNIQLKSAPPKDNHTNHCKRREITPLQLPGCEVDLGTAEVPPAALAVLLVMLWRFPTAAIAPRKVSGGKPRASFSSWSLDNLRRIISHNQQFQCEGFDRETNHMVSRSKHQQAPPPNTLNLHTWNIWSNTILLMLMHFYISHHKSQHKSSQRASLLRAHVPHIIYKQRN